MTPSVVETIIETTSATVRALANEEPANAASTLTFNALPDRMKVGSWQTWTTVPSSEGGNPHAVFSPTIFVHTKLGSSVQSFRHPSVFKRFPSSHCSLLSGSYFPFPQ